MKSTTVGVPSCGALLLATLIPMTASADFGSVCLFQGGGGTGSGMPLCVETFGGGGGAVGSFQAVPLAGLPASATSTNPVAAAVAGAGGLGGLSASASASSDYGVLRVVAAANAPSVASVPVNDTSQYLAVARAGAYFVDEGIIHSPNLAIGTPVQATATLDIVGTFGKFGEARFDFVATGGTLVHGTVLAFNPRAHLVFALPNLVVGTNLVVKLDLVAQATAFVQTGTAGLLFDIADVGNTAHFFLNFNTPGVTYGALSGHDYSAPVPLPLPFALLVSALGGMAAMRRRQASAPVAHARVGASLH